MPQHLPQFISKDQVSNMVSDKSKSEAKNILQNLVNQGHEIEGLNYQVPDFGLKDKFITTRKVKEILGDRDPSEKRIIIKSLVDSGNEIEGLNTEFSPLNAVKNVPESLLEFGKSIWGVATNPKKTATALGGTAFGGILNTLEFLGVSESDDPKKREIATKAKDMWNNAVNFFFDRYWSKERFLETIERDPVGFLSDVSVFASAGATAAGKVATTGRTAAKLNRFAKSTNKVLKSVADNSDIVKLTTKLPKATTSAIKKVNKKLGVTDRILETVGSVGTPGLQLSGSQAKNIAKNTFGKSPGQVLAEWGIKGDLPQIKSQLINRAKITRGMVDNELAKIGGIFRNENAFKALRALRDRFAKASSKEFRNISKQADNLLNKHSNKGLTLTEFNDIKRMVQRLMSIYNKSGDVKAAFKSTDLANIEKGLRKFIEKKADDFNLLDVKHLNKETKFAEDLQRMISDKVLSNYATTRRFTNEIFVGAGLVGAIAYWNPQILFTGVALATTNEILRSARFRTALSSSIHSLSGAEKNSLFNAIRTGKNTKQSISAFRKSMRRVADVAKELNFPAINMAGVVTEKALEDR